MVFPWDVTRDAVLQPKYRLSVTFTADLAPISRPLLRFFLLFSSIFIHTHILFPFKKNVSEREKEEKKSHLHIHALDHAIWLMHLT